VKNETFHATVYYRTQSNCNTWMGDVEAANHDDALLKARSLFGKRRPRAIRVDCVEVKASQESVVNLKSTILEWSTK